MLNTRFDINEQGVDVAAATSIAANEALSFDYNTTKWKVTRRWSSLSQIGRLGLMCKASLLPVPRIKPGFSWGGLVAPHIRILAEHNYWLNC